MLYHGYWRQPLGRRGYIEQSPSLSKQQTELSDFVNIRPCLSFMSDSAAIFSASADVTTGVPKVLQHLAHLSIRQSRRVALVAGTSRNKPSLRALMIAFINIQVMFLPASLAFCRPKNPCKVLPPKQPGCKPEPRKPGLCYL